MLDKTMTFALGDDREDNIKKILTVVYDALREKGYNPSIRWLGIFFPRIPLILRHTTAHAA